MESVIGVGWGFTPVVYSECAIAGNKLHPRCTSAVSVLPSVEILHIPGQLTLIYRYGDKTKI